MSESETVTDGYVRFWIEAKTGTEFVMLKAADYRAAMRERDRALLELERLREQIDGKNVG